MLKAPYSGKTMSKPPNNKTPHTESGNIFIMVMLGIVLFAALMFTFSKGVQQGGHNVSDKQAELAADDILAFSQRVQRGVNLLLNRGCSETEISFDNDFVGGYFNANSPVDETCHVFRQAGANVTYTPPHESWLNQDDADNASEAAFTNLYGQWYIPRRVCVTDVGTGDLNCFQAAQPPSVGDLVLMLLWLKDDICHALAKKTGTDSSGNAPFIGSTSVASGGQKFVGNFETAQRARIARPGIETSCFRKNSSQGFPGAGSFFYHVLMAR